MANKPRIAWDSCVILDALDDKSPRYPHVSPMYNDAIIGKVEIVVSEISVAEVCKLTPSVSAGRVTTAQAISMVNGFFDNKFIIRIPVDRSISMLAAKIIRDHNLETCDALIVAAAIETANVVVLYSADGKALRKKQPSPLKCNGLIGSPALSIKKPDALEWVTEPFLITP